MSEPTLVQFDSNPLDASIWFHLAFILPLLFWCGFGFDFSCVYDFEGKKK